MTGGGHRPGTSGGVDVSARDDHYAAIAGFARQAQPQLTTEMADEIQRRIEVYGPRSGNVYISYTRLTIAAAVDYFIAHLENPRAPRAELDDVLRRIGRGEAYEGRSVETLISAFGVGADVANRYLAAAARALGESGAVDDGVAAEIADFIESLAEQTAIGYREAQAQLSAAAHQWRATVLELILAGTDAPVGELARNAAAGNWELPESVVLVAVEPDVEISLPSARMLSPRWLANLLTARPVVLVPAPLTDIARSELATLFAGHRVALGCTVPLAESAASLRWARRALDLADAGVIPDEPVIDSAEHIGTLWMHSEPLLVDILNRTLLAPLYAEPPNSRRILGETLLAWIETRGASAPAIAALLGKHPQTIRYRLRRVRAVFGSMLDQPDRVTELHYALRAGAAGWNGGLPAPNIPSSPFPADLA